MDLTILQGRTARYLLGPLLAADGSVYDLASNRLRLMVKPQLTDPDASASLDYAIRVDAAGAASGAVGMTLGGTDTTQSPAVSYTTAAEGVVTVTFGDGDTRSLAPGSYQWELVTMIAGDTWQLLAGTLTITDTLIDDPEAA